MRQTLITALALSLLWPVGRAAADEQAATKTTPRTRYCCGLPVSATITAPDSDLTKARAAQATPPLSAESSLQRLARKESTGSRAGPIVEAGSFLAAGAGILALTAYLRAEQGPEYHMTLSDYTIASQCLAWGCATGALGLLPLRDAQRSAMTAWAGKVVQPPGVSPETAARREQRAREILRALAARDSRLRQIVGISSIALGVGTLAFSFATVNEVAQSGAQPIFFLSFGPIIQGFACLSRKSRCEKAYDEYLSAAGAQKR
jgi:hypothetical protein